MFSEPKVIFWPVGTGDSTTVVIKEGIVLQIDLRHLEKSEDQDDDHVALIDKLVEELPSLNNAPYLAVFALTHPDKDHILGFAELLEKIHIGELWFTPRVFLENDNDLCEDAIAFKEEAERRLEQTINNPNNVDSGDRIRVIGYDNILKEAAYVGFPNDKLTVPGNSITELDGEDYAEEFNAFIHAPFKDEDEGDRNNTSLAMQVLLGQEPAEGGVLLFGDIAYPRIRKIFDQTKAAGNEDYLAWKVFLAPHHCSKSAMYNEEDGKKVLKQDMLDDLEAYQVGDGTIVSSSEKIPNSNQKGDNPPHARAKNRYQEIASNGFLCTHEDTADSEPIIFIATETGFNFETEDSSEFETKSQVDHISSAVTDARGSDEPPVGKVGFGK